MKKKISDNIYDIKMKTIHQKWIDSWKELEAVTRDTIIKNNVIALYPEGTDKKIAEQEAEQQRKKLVNYISAYEENRHEFLAFCESHKKDLMTTTTWARSVDSCPTSHYLVEKAYHNFIKGEIF